MSEMFAPCLLDEILAVGMVFQLSFLEGFYD